MAGARPNAARATRSFWAAGPSEAGTLRSLLAGVNRDGQLVYVGRIGTGYTRKTAKELLPQLKALTVEQSPFGGDNAPAEEKRRALAQAQARG